MPIDRRYPIGGEMSDVVRGIVGRLRVTALQERYSSVAVLGAFAFVNGCLSIGIMAGAALVAGQPLIFPSLGPTAGYAINHLAGIAYPVWRPRG